MKLTIEIEKCKGCTYCIKECPQEALSTADEVNKMGYEVVKVDHDKCTRCGLCYIVCPDQVFEIVEDGE